MEGSDSVDYYEVLQVSRNADSETIDRVFRFLAKRYHPDNQEGGDSDRFALIAEAFRVLANPEKRVEYDARHERIREARWRMLVPDSAQDEFSSDRQIRAGILSLLYSSRRQEPDHPGMGVYELERLLDCPEDHMKFHIWYLREQGWVERLDNGMYAISAAGVDQVTEQGLRPAEPLRLPRGNGPTEGETGGKSPSGDG